MPEDLILGTAGHIDHGKTALVKALTGVDTDRLPEEKRRGITIELGFAELDLGHWRLGIVDVPGHERFVRNMLAGATGIDLALLVVAADESIKPQTREHLEILKLLGVPAGVIALTKCDLVDDDWLALVKDEVRALAAGSFLADAEIVATSAARNQGLDDLRAALKRAAQTSAARRVSVPSAPFRLPIDRSFTMPGHGTVVTGSVVSGTVAVGDELAIEPAGLVGRVRRLQNHGRTVDALRRGQRGAINLAGVHHGQLGRGQELATPGHLAPSRLVSVELRLLGGLPRPLKHRARVRCHVGTAEVMAAISLLDCDQLAPGGGGFAQLIFSRPVVSSWGQPFVIRSQSPLATIGGGRVLDPDALRLRKGRPEALARLRELASGDPLTRAAAALALRGLRGWKPLDLARLAAIDDPAAILDQLRRQEVLAELRLPPARHWRLHRDVLSELGLRIEGALVRLHAAFPRQRWIEAARVEQHLAHAVEAPLVAAAAAWLVAQGRLETSTCGIALAGRGPDLSPNERSLLAGLVARYETAGLQPPSVAELTAQIAQNQAAVPQLLKLAASQGELVQIAPELYLHPRHLDQIRATLAHRLSDGAGLTVSQIREILGTSRKYAVPLCEYLDRVGFTMRRGDLRVLAGGSSTPSRSAAPPISSAAGGGEC